MHYIMKISHSIWFVLLKSIKRYTAEVYEMLIYLVQRDGKTILFFTKNC